MTVTFIVCLNRNRSHFFTSNRLISVKLTCINVYVSRNRLFIICCFCKSFSNFYNVAVLNHFFRNNILIQRTLQIVAIPIIICCVKAFTVTICVTDNAKRIHRHFQKFRTRYCSVRVKLAVTDSRYFAILCKCFYNIFCPMTLYIRKCFVTL